ncbi:MAG: hypothetical protein IPH28_25240 [Cytophagaceae bacterium]|nr:hypothetical protein [Cytophagaceae bacterium]
MKVGNWLGIPQAKGYYYTPPLQSFTKNKTSDAAVIICPGGGYYILA